MFFDRIRWLAERDRMFTSQAKIAEKGAVFNHAVRKYEMWERFKSHFFGVEKKLDTADLSHQPDWPTERHEDFQELKERWDEGEFDEEIAAFGGVEGVIDALAEVLKQHEAHFTAWIEKQRAAEEKKKNDERVKEEILKRRDGMWKLFTERLGSLQDRSPKTLPAPVWPKPDDDTYKALHQDLENGEFYAEELTAYKESASLTESLHMTLLGQEAYITEFFNQQSEARTKHRDFDPKKFQFVMPLELQEAIADKGDALKHWVRQHGEKDYGYFGGGGYDNGPVVRP